MFYVEKLQFFMFTFKTVISINLLGFHIKNTKPSNNKKEKETMVAVSNEMKYYFQKPI